VLQLLAAGDYERCCPDSIRRIWPTVSAFVICSGVGACDIVNPMANFPQPNRKIRAPRVNLWGTASATIQLENGRQFWARALRISTTGGLLEIAKCIDEGLSVSLTVHFGDCTVRGKAGMLFPMRAEQGYQQPFHFTDLRNDQLLTLQAEIAELLKQAKPSAHRGYAFKPQHFMKPS
jgi:hypothetical protein